MKLKAAWYTYVNPTTIRIGLILAVVLLALVAPGVAFAEGVDSGGGG